MIQSNIVSVHFDYDPENEFEDLEQVPNETNKYSRDGIVKPDY